MKSLFHRSTVILLVPVLFLSLHRLASAADAPTVSAADQAFVAKVSQGGMFEVESSKFASDHATSPDVRTLAATEVADHDKVNAELQSLVTAKGMNVSMQLDAKHQKMLDKLDALTGKAYDDAYLKSMARVHHTDDGLFAEEALSGSDPDFKGFAEKTDMIVKRHIASLKDVTAKTKS